MTKNDAQQKKKTNGRYESTNYRYTDKFINRMTGWLVALIFIGPAIGLGLFVLGYALYDGAHAPDWYNIMCASFALGGIFLPLVISAWLGATALNKYAGPVGLLLVFGIGAVAGSKSFDNPTMWYWIGIGSLVLSGLLFFYLGFQAKVPIWLQLPILNSPRLYISKGDTKTSQKAPKKK